MFRPQICIVMRGMESIRTLEKYSAPLLVAMSVALLAWALLYCLCVGGGGAV